MKHITWLLVVLALGCGRDKKAWARKIDRLVERVYACKDVACAKAVDAEMGKIIGSDEEGRNLDKGEPEFMFSSAERIRNRVAELEADAKLTAVRAASPLSALEVFSVTMQVCALAMRDLHGPTRAEIEATIAKVGAVMPPDKVGDAKEAGGMRWFFAFGRGFQEAMENKVPVEDSIYSNVAGDLCLIAFFYEPTDAKDPKAFGPTVDRLEKMMNILDQGALVKDLVAVVRSAAPAKAVDEQISATITAIRAALKRGAQK